MKKPSLSDMILKVLAEDILADGKGLTPQQIMDRLQVDGQPAENRSRQTRVPYLRIIDGGRS